MKSTSRLMIVMWMLVVSHSSSAADAVAYDPSSDLMTVFGAKCKGYGALNATSFNESQSLVNILNDVSADPKCQGLKTALQQVSSLNINRMLAQPDARLNVEEMVSEAANLQLAILQENARGADADTVYLQALKTNSAELRIKINNLSSNQKVSARKGRLETIQNVDTYTTSLMSNLEQGDACFSNRANVPAQIGAQVLGITAGLGAGFTGSLLLTAGRAVDHFIRYMRTKGLNNDIQKIVDTRIGQALGCAFEGISQTYCQAADYDVLLKADREAATQTGPQPTWKKGIDSIAQGKPAFDEFVNKVDAGSPKTTLGRVGDMQLAQGLRAQYDLAVTQKDYLTTTGFGNVAELTDRAAKENEFKKLLADLAQLITPSQSCSASAGSATCSVSGPFKNSFIEDATCGPLIYVYTKGQERTMKAGTTNITCSQYLKNINPQPTLEDLPKMKEAMDSIFGEASNFVVKELSKVQQSSNVQVLTSAQLNISGRTALDYFKESRAYLDTLLKDPQSIASDGHAKMQVEETQKRIRNVQDLLENNVPRNEQDASDTVAKVAKELIPKGDKAAIPSAMNMIVQLDIEQKIAKGDIDPTLKTLMSLPNSGSIGQLLQVFGNLDPSGQQTRNAREISEGNLSGLASALSAPLKARFEALKKKSDQKDEDAENSLATLCIQTATVPEAPSISGLDLNNYCKGSAMKSVYNDSGLIIKYDDVIKADKRTRTCSLHDFYRKSSLYGKKKDFQDSRSRNTK